MRKLINAFSPASMVVEGQLIEALLKSQRNPKAALKHFQLAQMKGSISSIDSLCILLHILVETDRQSSARELLRCSLLHSTSPSPATVVDGLVNASRRCVSDPRSFGYLLTCYSHAGKAEQALEAFDCMLQHGVFPSVRSRNDFLAALVRSNLTTKAREVYRVIKEKEMGFDCYTIDIMMHACLKDGKSEEAQVFFQDLRDTGLEPDLLVYATIIQSVCRIPDSTKALELLNSDER